MTATPPTAARDSRARPAGVTVGRARHTTSRATNPSTGRAVDELAAPPLPGDLREVSHSTVELAGGRIELAHPADAMDLLYRQNFGASGYEADYWAQPWPCGNELAKAVALAVPDGARVLELGCGLALPSLAAARSGARVLATDQAPGALAFAEYNARRNDIPLETAVCGWAEPTVALAGAPWDLVLAADVLYLNPALDDLARLLPRLVGDGGEIWIADQARPPARDFLAACRRWATISTVDTADPAVSIHRLRPHRS